MNHKPLSVLLITTFIGGFFPSSSVQARTTPEQRCFTHLINAAKNEPAFAGIDFGAVRKISGSTGNLVSQPFSIETYDDFIEVFSKDVPFQAQDLEHYPNDMDGNVPHSQKFKPRIHKSNRINNPTIIFNNGIKTDIDHWVSSSGNSIANDIKKFFTGQKSGGWMDSRHNRQTIDGYFVDSRFVTFGRESGLDFMFPTRAANPDQDGYFPTGRPIMDMREFLVFTQHLKNVPGNPNFNGELLSCQIAKVEPKPGYDLMDYDFSGNGIGWENYGGTRISESDATTAIRGGGEFRKAEIDFTISLRSDTSKDLLEFKTLSMHYNNGNPFLNTFETTEWFKEEMYNAKNVTATFLEMRRAFYDRIVASGMLIGQNASLFNSGDPIADLPTGHWCGIGFSHQTNPMFTCEGEDPRSSCPAGYQQRNWVDLTGIGAGVWGTCFSDTSQEISDSRTNFGYFCGLRMENDPSRVVLCQGTDPRDAVPSIGTDSCPAGYVAATFADMGPVYQGQWTTCRKQNNANGSTGMSGTLCGIKMEHHTSPVVSCGGLDPEDECPVGYTSTQWANINPSWGRWHSCVRD